MPHYGGYGGSTWYNLNQGRIYSIEWGWWHQTWDSWYGALILKSFQSDEKSGHFNPFPDGQTQCQSFTLTSSDFIAGYKIHYTENYVLGLTFYSFEGETHSCYNNDIINDPNINISIHTQSPNELFNNTQDFYFLSGWQGQFGAAIDGIQFQFTHISAAAVPFTPVTPSPSLSPNHSPGTI